MCRRVCAADIAQGTPDADIFVNLREADLIRAVQQATDGKGVDIVLDSFR